MIYLLKFCTGLGVVVLLLWISVLFSAGWDFFSELWQLQERLKMVERDIDNTRTRVVALEDKLFKYKKIK